MPAAVSSTARPSGSASRPHRRAGRVTVQLHPSGQEACPGPAGRAPRRRRSPSARCRPGRSRPGRVRTRRYPGPPAGRRSPWSIQAIEPPPAAIERRSRARHPVVLLVQEFSSPRRAERRPSSGRPRSWSRPCRLLSRGPSPLGGGEPLFLPTRPPTGPEPIVVQALPARDGDRTPPLACMMNGSRASPRSPSVYRPAAALDSAAKRPVRRRS